MGALIAPRLLYAVTPISEVSTFPVSNSTTGINNTPGLGDFTGLWDVTFDGGDDEIQTIKVGTNAATDPSYEFVTLADELRLRRGISPVVGNRELLFCRGNPALGNTIPCEGSTLTDMKTVLLGRSLNFGTDNIFANNGGTNSNNVERLDYIYKTGISVTGTSINELGFVILERGGNDGVKIAPILAVDSSFNPTNFGTLVTINSGNWGPSGISYPAVVFRRDPGEVDYRPSADLGVQNVGGVLVTFTELGIASGQTIYGYALFPEDVTDSNTPLASFPANSNTGLDLIEGGGFFRLETGTEFIDMFVDKVANNPIAAQGDTVTFTITVENLTLGVGVVDADFSDVLPSDLTNIQWTCQAFGSAGTDPDDVNTTCLNDTVTDTGSASSLQIEADQTIGDVIDIAIGGRVVYEVTATLIASATGTVDNTAAVSTDTVTTGQTEISVSNNTDTATISVQAPGILINVDSITYSPAKAATGENVIITTVVSDPQGEADIASATFDWFNQNGVTILNDELFLIEVVDTDPLTKTFQFTVNIPNFSTSTGNWLATVTATDIGGATHSKSAVLEVDEPDLSGSYKSVVNLSSTGNNQGDTLEFTVGVAESNGVNASNVRIVDNVPSNTTLVGGSLSLCVDASPPSTCTTLIAGPGADYTNNSTATLIDVSGLTVPANALVKLTFGVTIGVVAAGDLVANRTTISTPDITFSRDAADLVVFGPPQGPGGKFLYLDSALDLSRAIDQTPAATLAINGNGGNVSFTLAPTPADLTLPSGTVINIDLMMERIGGNNNRDVIIALRYGPNGTETLIGTTPEQTIQPPNGAIALQSFVLPALGGDVFIPAGNRITLTVTNTTNRNNRRFIIHNTGIGDFSQIALTVTPVINVDSLTFRSAPNGGGLLVANPEPGTTLYARAVVSDPFGAADIIAIPAIALTPPPGSGTGSATVTFESTITSSTTTKIFEWQIDLPPAGSGNLERERGNWSVQVTAVEGQDDLAGNTRVTHTVATGFTTLSQPNLSTSTKTVSFSGDADPGDPLTYTITLINSGGQTATNVSLADTLDPLLTYASASSTCLNGSGAAVTLSASGGIVTAGGIRLISGASCTFTLNTTVGGAVGNTIDNTAAITNPGGPGATVIAPTVIVSESQIPVTADKLLYLALPGSLSRAIPSSAGVTSEIAGGDTSVSFDFIDAIKQDVTLDDSTATVRLWLNRAGNNNLTRGVNVALFYNNGLGFEPMGSQELNIDLDDNTPSEHVFTIPGIAAPVVLNMNADFRLTVTNTTNQGNRRLQINQVATAAYAAVAIPLTDAIKVTDVAFYDLSGNDAPGCSPGCGSLVTVLENSAGETIWARATVGDAFGSIDINTGCGALGSTDNCPTFTLTDPNANPPTPGTLAFLADPTPSTRQFEVALSPVGITSPLGLWQVKVEASEGREGTVKDSLSGSFELFAQPSLTIVKSVSSPNASPNELLTFTNIVQNGSASMGIGPAINVKITNTLGPFISLQIFVSGGSWQATTSLSAPYEIVLNEEFDNGVAGNDFGYVPSVCGIAASLPENSTCVDSAIREFRTTIEGVFPPDGNLQQQYESRVE
ncbi:MAG: putative repeat protein (TIGR01451 family) [Candidatus Azotimanducaceae bacterium]